MLYSDIIKGRRTNLIRVREHVVLVSDAPMSRQQAGSQGLSLSPLHPRVVSRGYSRGRSRLHRMNRRRKMQTLVHIHLSLKRLEGVLV